MKVDSLPAPPLSLCCSDLRAPITGLPLPLGGVGPLPESLTHLPSGQRPGRRPPHQAGGPLELEALAQQVANLPPLDAQLDGRLPPLPGPLPGPEAAATGR